MNESDREWLISVYSKASTGRFIPSGPWVTDEIIEREMSKRLARQGFDSPAGAVSLVALHDGQRVADVMGWYTEAEMRDREHRTAEIGWVGDPAFAGQGFVTEAAAGLLEHMFTAASAHRVEAHLDPRNGASARIAERLGMTREAHLRDSVWMHGEWCDTLIYGKLASEHAA